MRHRRWLARRLRHDLKAVVDAPAAAEGAVLVSRFAPEASSAASSPRRPWPCFVGVATVSACVCVSSFSLCLLRPPSCHLTMPRRPSSNLSFLCCGVSVPYPPGWSPSRLCSRCFSSFACSRTPRRAEPLGHAAERARAAQGVAPGWFSSPRCRSHVRPPPMFRKYPSRLMLRDWGHGLLLVRLPADKAIGPTAESGAGREILPHDGSLWAEADRHRRTRSDEQHSANI